jgi:hypothetical protein
MSAYSRTENDVPSQKPLARWTTPAGEAELKFPLFPLFSKGNRAEAVFRLFGKSRSGVSK